MMLKRLLTAASLAALAACATTDAAKTAAAAPEAPNGAIAARPMRSAPLDPAKTLTRIVFASCAQQNEDQSIWSRIADDRPDLVLYMGDNVYGDVRSNDPALPELKAAYMRLAMSEPFARVRSSAPLLAVWDDHDFGLNDGGGDYQYKEQSEALFEYAWDVRDERASRPGVYGSWSAGAEGKRVQIIMLDTRFFRSPLKPTDEQGARGKERWLPDADPAKTMLGPAQWAWLEEELKKPADLRLLVSSIQVLSEGHGWEAWRELPLERERLYDVIRRSGAERLVVLSGDRHSAALYEKGGVVGYPLIEATSSSLNLPASKWRAASGETWVEIDPNRTSDMFYDANYGGIRIDWEKGEVELSINRASGETALSRTLSFSELERAR